MCVLSIKVPIRKMSGNLFNDPRTSVSLRPNSEISIYFIQQLFVFQQNFLVNVLNSIVNINHHEVKLYNIYFFIKIQLKIICKAINLIIYLCICPCIFGEKTQKNTKVKICSPDGDTDYFDIVAGVLAKRHISP